MPEPCPPLPGGRKLAAPSWVLPGTIAENCRFLAGKVHEVGLLFFETASCLAYTEEDLPPPLSDLPLSFHAHLPTDLPRGGAQAAAICLALMERVAFLGVRRAVLHPPPPSQAPPDREPLEYTGAWLREFALCWRASNRDTADLLLENTEHGELTALLPVIEALGLSLCLDTGHALAYGQRHLFLHPAVLARTRMVHVSAPGKGAAKNRHLPLTSLSPEDGAALRNLLFSVSQSAVCMLELFSTDDFFNSLPILHSWLEPSSAPPGNNRATVITPP